MRRNSIGPPYARAIIVDGAIALDSSYDASLAAAIKALPSGSRRWDAANRRWLVAPQHRDMLIRACQEYLGVALVVPEDIPAQVVPQIRVITLEYLGTCKDRGDAQPVAYGYVDGDWSLAIPEPVLRQWFKDDAPMAGLAGQREKSTLYALLGVGNDADDDAIKRAYKRLARQWHPDMCSEPNAGEMFRALVSARNILVDPLLRKKYDAGLFFEARSHDDRAHAHRYQYRPEYRAPLRCGALIVTAASQMGRWLVSTIHQWDDLTDSVGRTLVTSWNSETREIERRWV